MSSWFGRIQHRVDTLQASPVWAALGETEQRAFAARMLDADDWSKVAQADKDLIRRGEFEVSAGNSEVLVGPAVWGDHERIDAAIDADDEAALDAALFTVGSWQGLPVEWETGEPASELDDDPDGDEPEVKATEVGLDAADFEWIGL